LDSVIDYTGWARSVLGWGHSPVPPTTRSAAQLCNTKEDLGRGPCDVPGRSGSRALDTHELDGPGSSRSFRRHSGGSSRVSTGGPARRGGLHARDGAV